MASQQNHMQAAVKREISKLYKDNFGKGPEDTHIVFFEHFMYLKLIGITSQIEESLMKTEGGKKLVRKIREELINTHTSMFVTTIENIIQAKIKKVSFMTEHEKDTMYMFILFEDQLDLEMLTK